MSKLELARVELVLNEYLRSHSEFFVSKDAKGEISIDTQAFLSLRLELEKEELKR